MQLKERSDQPHGTWEEVYRNVKRVDRMKNELHERDEKELERTGQPLCIYEPFSGEGTWPFLHQSSLYRGIGLVSCCRLLASTKLFRILNGHPECSKCICFETIYDAINQKIAKKCEV